MEINLTITMTYLQSKTRIMHYSIAKLGQRLPIIFSTSCKKFKIFPFILFEKRRLAHGIRRTKAADSPLEAH